MTFPKSFLRPESAFLYLSLFLASLYSTYGSGIVTNLSESALKQALEGGGTVSFATSGTIVLTNTLIIDQDTFINGSNQSVTISGGNMTRLFQVLSNVVFQVSDITLADGMVQGTNGTSGSFPLPGESVRGAGILNLGGNLVCNRCVLTNHNLIGGAGGDNFSTTNTAHGGDALGAAICSIGGNINLTNCVLTGDAVAGGAGGGSGPLPYPGEGGRALGGAIFCEDGNASMEGVVFSKCVGQGGIPGLSDGPNVYVGRGAVGAGGAIYVSNSIIRLENAFLVSNSVKGGGTPSNGPLLISGFPSADGLGGAAYLSGGSTGIVRMAWLDANSAVGGNAGKFFASGGGKGGAFFSEGVLQVYNSSFSNNVCVGGALSSAAGPGQGGAVCTVGSLVMDGCAVIGNHSLGGGTSPAGGVALSPGAGEGGGVWSSGILSVTNSTFANNDVVGGENFAPLAPGGKGGSGFGGGAFINGGSAALVNVTIVANRADPGTNWALNVPSGLAVGGGLFCTNVSPMLRNSILANNVKGGDAAGMITDGGYNICSDTTAAFSGVGSANTIDPLLGPLGYYGGMTATLPLLRGSPAIDAGGLAGAPATDQRGRTRPFGSAVDIGAFESSPPYVIVGRVSGFRLENEFSIATATTNTVTGNHRFRLDGFAPGTFSINASGSNYVLSPSTQEITVGPDQLDVIFQAFGWHTLTPEPITNNLEHLVLAASPGTAWRVLASTNILDWAPVATNTVGPGSIVEWLLPSEPEVIYRAVSP